MDIHLQPIDVWHQPYLRWPPQLIYTSHHKNDMVSFTDICVKGSSWESSSVYCLSANVSHELSQYYMRLCFITFTRIDQNGYNFITSHSRMSQFNTKNIIFHQEMLVHVIQFFCFLFLFLSAELPGVGLFYTKGNRVSK